VPYLAKTANAKKQIAKFNYVMVIAVATFDPSNKKIIRLVQVLLQLNIKIKKT